MKRIPVTYKGKTIGYTEDEGKTIHFNESDGAKTVICMLNSGNQIGISSRGIGKINSECKIEKRELTEFIIFDI